VGGYAGRRADGLSGYASSAGLGVIFTENESCEKWKNFNAGANLLCCVKKLIRSSMIVTLTKRDVDIKLGPA
jgi:hypothetical protein